MTPDGLAPAPGSDEELEQYARDHPKEVAALEEMARDEEIKRPEIMAPQEPVEIPEEIPPLKD